jgi:glycolate oxidase iron-sulfur subunit
MDVAFADVNQDTIELLLHHGCEVVIPRKQNCCGSLQAHNGDMIGAREMARRNVLLFAGIGVEAIVMNSAGCGAFMKEYAHVFAEEPGLAQPAQEVSKKTKDVTEFLDAIGFRPAKGGESTFRGKRVTYHDACHLAHTQKITQEPRRLIRSVPETTFVELPESSWCCGSAGIYNVVQYDSAMQLLDRKLSNVRATAPDIIVTGNPGCMLQIQHGLRKEGLAIEILHTATFLRRACGI